MNGILLDANGDLPDGLMKIGNADPQNIESVLAANRGEFKDLPLIGGEAIKRLKGTSTSLWCTQVKKQLNSLGIAVTKVEMTDTEINVAL